MGADDNAVEAPVQHFGDMRFGTQAAAELTGHAGRSKDAANARAVAGAALFGSVQIHEVQVFRALSNPALRGHPAKRFQSLYQKRPAGLARRVWKEKARDSFDEDFVVEQMADFKRNVATHIVRRAGDLADDF